MKKIVTIGGGTGTFVVLSGLRAHDTDLVAIVTVTDAGGSTGRLRDAYGYLPPGDARQALVALSEEGSTLRKLFSHRFGKGDVAGHNFGNLFLTALTEIFGSDRHALAEASSILKVSGRVIPVSDTPAVLCAEYHDGTCLVGEVAIESSREQRGVIKRLFLQNECNVSSDAVAAVGDADLIVLGPGDIYTSILANFVTNGLSQSVAQSKAKLVYVMNLFSTPESGEMHMSEYVRSVSKYTTRTPDVIIVNSSIPAVESIAYYQAKSQYPLVDDLGSHPSVVRLPLMAGDIHTQHEHDVVDRSLVRHDPYKLASALMNL